MAVKRVERARVSQKNVQVMKSKGQQKQVNKVNIRNKKALVIAQEIKFARLLANKDKKVRDKVLKNLKKWLTVRSKSSFVFTDTDFMRLWKGLFYCMWMSDKPLIQEDLAESLSKIVHCFNSKEIVSLYTTCALKTLATEWFSIDQYRLDKFAMLVRKIFRQTFQICKTKLWNMEWVEGVSQALEKIILHPKTCVGFNLHIAEIYWEELAKISEGCISEDVVTELIKPFIIYITVLDDERQIKHFMRHIFRYLIFQSDIGIEYSLKFEAWKQAGFPCENINDIEKIELSDVEEENCEDDENDVTDKKENCDIQKPLDPRAGKVDIELPQLLFNAKMIAELLTQYRFHPSSTAKSRRQIAHLIKEFTEVSQGNMPLGVQEIRISNTQKKNIDTKKATLDLLGFEKELYNDKVQHKRKRKRNGKIEDENFAESLSNVQDKHTSEDVNINNKKNENTQFNGNLIQSKSRDSNDSVLKKKKETAQEETIKKKCNENNISKLYKIRLNKVKKNKVIKFKESDADVKDKVKLIKKKFKTYNINESFQVSDNTEPVSPSTLTYNSSNNSKNLVEICDKPKSNKTTIKNCVVLNKSTGQTHTNGIWLTPVLTKLEQENKKSLGLKGQTEFANEPNLKKRVKIVLQRNTTQHTSEYIQQIRKSPAIPFDANKRPLAGVLKASPIPSPVNPFYKRNVKL